MEQRLNNEMTRRALGRRDWKVCKFRLGDEPSENLASTTTAEERLQMMWPLAVEAWSLSGRPMPDYERKDTPINRFVMPSD